MRGELNRQDVIARLRENETALRSRGVAHAAVFGSRARGDAGPDSDTDIMIEIDPDAHIGVWGYAGLKEYIATLFDGPVDVVDREALKPYVAPAATADRHLCLLTPARCVAAEGMGYDALRDDLRDSPMPLRAVLRSFPRRRGDYRTS